MVRNDVSSLRGVVPMVAIFGVFIRCASGFCGLFAYLLRGLHWVHLALRWPDDLLNTCVSSDGSEGVSVC
ncbi:hypothetical protein LX36DRAFT_219461 [Colletotrichum falcatum]|nr:hypothetical protein LX36DRAFT_219461 [Colletotrichum falcatum]